MGFWEYQAEDKLEDLDGLRAQPVDTITKVATFDVESHWDYWEERCLPYAEPSHLEVWHSLHDGDEFSDFCVIPAKYWVDWGLYQPTRLEIIDFNDANGHADSDTSRNSGRDIKLEVQHPRAIGRILGDYLSPFPSAPSVTHSER